MNPAPRALVAALFVALAVGTARAQAPLHPGSSSSSARLSSELEEGGDRALLQKPDDVAGAPHFAGGEAPQTSFAELARSVSEVMRSGRSARQEQWQVAALLSDYLQGYTLETKFQRPNPALPVTTYLLHRDPQGLFSIAALVFRPHARTTVHDHQSWVVWGTYSGEERETRYRRADVSGEAFPRLEPAWSAIFAAGSVSFIDPPPRDIHDVENVGDAVSVSIHVHATDIANRARNAYDVKRKIIKSFVQSYEPAM